MLTWTRIWYHVRGQVLRFQLYPSSFFSELEVSVFDENRTTELLGQCIIDIAHVFEPGGGRNYGDVTLECFGKYAGEIKLDVTFYDSRKDDYHPVFPQSSLSSGEKRSMETAFNSPQKLNFDIEDKQDPVKKTKKDVRRIIPRINPSDPERKFAESQRLHDNVTKMMLGLDPRFDHAPASPSKISRSSSSLPVSRERQSRPHSPRSPTRTSELHSSKDTMSSRGRSARLEDNNAHLEGQGSPSCSSRSSVQSQVSHPPKASILLGSNSHSHHLNGPQPMELDDDDNTQNSHETDHSAPEMGHNTRKPKKLQIHTNLLRSFTGNKQFQQSDGRSMPDITLESQPMSANKSSKWSLFRTEASKQVRNFPFMNINGANSSKFSLFPGSSSARPTSPERSLHDRPDKRPLDSYPPSPVSPFTGTATWPAGSQPASPSNLSPSHSGSSPLPSIYEAINVPQSQSDERRFSRPRAILDRHHVSREPQSYVDKVRRARESFSSQYRRQSHLQFGQSSSSSRNTTPRRPESDISPLPTQRPASPTKARGNYASLPTRFPENARTDDRPPADAATRQLRHAQDIMRQLRNTAGTDTNKHYMASGNKTDSTDKLTTEDDNIKRIQPREPPALSSLPLKPPSIPSVQTMAGETVTGPAADNAP